MPRKLICGSAGEPEAPTPPPEGQRRRWVQPEATPPVATEPAPEGRRRRLVDNGAEITYERAERPRTTVDYLVDRVVDQHPRLPTGRVRGRISMLLNPSIDLMMGWGEHNLVPLQQASTIQQEITTEVARIAATDLLQTITQASTRPPSFMDRLTGNVKSPDDYLVLLRNAKVALGALIKRIETLRAQFEPEVFDLQLDAVSLSMTLGEYTEPMIMQLANSRAKTMLQAHQTGTMLLQMLNQTMQQCCRSIEQIETMLSVTIPNWKMAIK